MFTKNILLVLKEDQYKRLYELYEKNYKVISFTAFLRLVLDKGFEFLTKNK